MKKQFPVFLAGMGCQTSSTCLFHKSEAGTANWTENGKKPSQNCPSQLPSPWKTSNSPLHTHSKALRRCKMVLSAAKRTRSESPCVAGSCEEFFKHSLAFSTIIASDCGFTRAAPVFLGQGFSVPPQQPEADFCAAAPLGAFIVGF